MPGLDPGIHRKCERPGESPAFPYLAPTEFLRASDGMKQALAAFEEA